MGAVDRGVDFGGRAGEGRGRLSRAAGQVGRCGHREDDGALQAGSRWTTISRIQSKHGRPRKRSSFCFSRCPSAVTGLIPGLSGLIRDLSPQNGGFWNSSHGQHLCVLFWPRPSSAPCTLTFASQPTLHRRSRLRTLRIRPVRLPFLHQHVPRDAAAVSCLRCPASHLSNLRAT